MRQTAFSFLGHRRTSFGGTELVGKRKSQRPLSTRKPMHLILKSDGQRIFNPGNEKLGKLVLRMANRFQITVQSQALNWTHIHLLIRIKNRQDYNAFIKVLTAKLAMAVWQAKRESCPVFQGKLLTLRPFTRIVEWGRDFHSVLHYIYENVLESQGHSRKRKQKQRKIPGLYLKNFRWENASAHS